MTRATQEATLRSTSFSLHRRRSRRRSPPPAMTRKKKPKQTPSGGNPTGSTSSTASSGSSASFVSDSSAQSPSSATSKLPGDHVPPANTSNSTPQADGVAVTAADGVEIENPNLTATVKSVHAETTDSPPVDVCSDPPQLPEVPKLQENGETQLPPQQDSTLQMSGDSEQAKKQTPNPADLWRGFVKTNSRSLKPEATPFTLESGESCVRIPNAVIEKNKKSWDCFILGQFYDDPPARAAVSAIVNGIWSRERRDIVVSKMDGNTFLFRVPCPNARRHILRQCIWQVDRQTMFVAKWSPGLTPEKPELSSIPVWLEFTGVPLQFFNSDALKEIAGMVGHPICLHPSTENMTNIEVAKVYTVIDPRKPLPEAVNAQFDSGEVTRIHVSSPWLPSLCSHCKKVGHTISRCSQAPPTCSVCRSVKHSSEACPRNNGSRKGKAPSKSHLPFVQMAPPDQKGPNTKASTSKRVYRKSPHVNKLLLASTKKDKRIPPQDSRRASGSKYVVKTPPSSSFCVDLQANLFSSPGKAAISYGASGSSGSSTEAEYSSDPISEDDDIPPPEEDRFIEVMTRKMQKQARKARAGGPKIL